MCGSVAAVARRFAESDGIHVVRMHDHAGIVSPIVTTLPLQLPAYRAALLRR
jgi:glutamine---fructose-6-phosphate transaminase (isomerizing)